MEKEQVQKWLEDNPDVFRELVYENRINKHNPVSNVLYVPIEKVMANDYNPNQVAEIEMGLLLLSIQQDGYTQPVVTYYNKMDDTYEIVDGYHRYYVMKHNEELLGMNGGLLPVVVIDKDINERRASTVRHNRARGVHTFNGMAQLVIDMTKDGWSDEDICNQLGMEADEIVRLKVVSGYASLYKDYGFSDSWIAGRVDSEEEDEG